MRVCACTPGIIKKFAIGENRSIVWNDKVVVRLAIETSQNNKIGVIAMNIRRYRFYRQVEGIADVTLYSTLDEVVFFKTPVIEHRYYCLDFYVSDADFDPAIISIETETFRDARSILKSIKAHMRYDLSTIDESDMMNSLWKNHKGLHDREFKKKFEI